MRLGLHRRGGAVYPDEEMVSIEDVEIDVPDSFRGYDPRGEVQMYSRNLPHWRQQGASYFVTFRAEDSIPEAVWEGMCGEAQQWKTWLADGGDSERMREDYRQFQRDFVRRLERMLDDCQGLCLLGKRRNRIVVADSLKHFHGQRYELYDAVIMPNHCHVLVRPYREWALEDIVGSWKSYTSRLLEGTSGGYWQAESHDRVVRDVSHFCRAARYILKNPAKANLAGNACWLWSNHLVHHLVENPGSGSSERSG